MDGRPPIPSRASTVAVVVAFNVNVLPDVKPAASKAPFEFVATTTTGFVTDDGRGTTAEPLDEGVEDPYGEVTSATLAVGIEGSKVTLMVGLVETGPGLTELAPLPPPQLVRSMVRSASGPARHITIVVLLAHGILIPLFSVGVAFCLRHIRRHVITLYRFSTAIGQCSHHPYGNGIGWCEQNFRWI